VQLTGKCPTNAFTVQVDFGQFDFSGNATSMIGLCQEGKSSPGALRRSAGVDSFLIPRRACWPLGRGSYFSIEPDFHLLAQPSGCQKIEFVFSCQSRN
jgi:hypothetical protein